MSRFYSHVNTAKALLSRYKGEMPFGAFIKHFFSKEKKYGGRDRKTINSLCYNYFRLGGALQKYLIDKGLLISHFLLTDVSSDWLQNERPDWNEKVNFPINEKLLLVDIDVQTIFPFNNELSVGVDVDSFNASFLIQPDLFIRIRPGKKEVIKQRLSNAGIEFTEITEACLSFANGTKLEEIIDLNKGAVIQDFNSQRAGELLPVEALQGETSVWDCCAASGGKSIMVNDLLPKIQLTVSDVRQSIIQNLHDRFADAGIKDYQYFVTDLTNPKSLESSVGNSTFQVVVCDAPCSGSGTWSRTPEQLSFFTYEDITRYSNLQKSIATNTIPYVKKGGYFLYITCSVFKKENEEVVEYIQQHSNLQLVKMELLKGYDIKADNMFAALFISEKMEHG